MARDVGTARVQASEPLVVYRSVDRDGATYALSRSARDRVRAAYGGAAHLPPRVYIAHETDADYRSIHGSVRRQVALLLTGLSDDRLSTLGEVRFVDPVTEQELER